MRATAPILAIALILSAIPAWAASTLDDPSLPGQSRYERCLYLAGKHPRQAYDLAVVWQGHDGAAPARHCVAVALVGLKLYSKAGGMLDALADGSAMASKADRAALYDQAGNAWLLGLRPDAAETSFSAALKLVPRGPDYLTDRARARAMRKNWSGADADLSAALALQPRRAELLVLRASARRALGHAKDARADVDRALSLHPNYDEALLERGTLRLDAGDSAGAEADWKTVEQLAPRTAAGREARKRIAELNVNVAPAKD